MSTVYSQKNSRLSGHMPSALLGLLHNFIAEVLQKFRKIRAGANRRWQGVLRQAEAGMSTAEYAVGTIAAVAFAAALIAVIKSPAVSKALSGIITKALSGF